MIFNRKFGGQMSKIQVRAYVRMCMSVDSIKCCSSFNVSSGFLIFTHKLRSIFGYIVHCHWQTQIQPQWICRLINIHQEWLSNTMTSIRYYEKSLLLTMRFLLVAKNTKKLFWYLWRAPTENLKFRIIFYFCQKVLT